MTTPAVTLFLALLAIVAEVAVLSGVVLAVGSRLSRSGTRAVGAVTDVLGPHVLTLAFGVAVIATAGSLYFSEVAHFIPCKLCWYQRIAMYPLAPILGIAAWRRDLRVRPYVLALAAIGGLISTYHVWLERHPWFESHASVCDPTNPCTLIWVKRFGYLTIPAMALSAFALIALLLLCNRDKEPDDGTRETATS